MFTDTHSLSSKGCWESTYNQIPNLEEVTKFKDGDFTNTNVRIKKFRALLEDIEYKVFVCGSRLPQNGRVISLVVVVYDTKLEYIKEAIGSVMHQDYDSVELIIVDHGTTGRVKSYLEDTASRLSHGLLLDVRHHIYPLDSTNPSERIALLWNAALLASHGDYIYLLSCDDKLSSCYATRMVNAFQRYSCTSVAPGIVIIDALSNIDIKETDRLSRRNQRRVLENSVELCKDYIQNGSKMAFPGGYLCQRSNRVKLLGGYDTDNDRTQLFNFATPGIIATDFQAKLYWRYHSNQANEQQVKHGCIYYRHTIENYLALGLFERHSRSIDKEFARIVKAFYYQVAKKEVLCQIQNSVSYGSSCQKIMLTRVFEQCDKRFFFVALCSLLKVNMVYFVRTKLFPVVHKIIRLVYSFSN